ncbi:MAG TPA: ROK family protein [Gaiellaceae bacterium]|nr:ROK family protein [Gaiellaceae bacterium]
MPTFRAGVDLGATKIQAVVVGPDHAVVGQARHPTPTEGGPPAVTAAIARAVEEAAGSAGVAVEELGGAGVGSPGAVDHDSGTVAHARNLPDWEEPFPLAAALADALDCPVRIDNDVQVAVLGELELGAGRPYSSFLGVWWGTGVGGGIVLDRKLWLGRGAAGEIGHMVVKRGGARCPCGRRGCLEAYAGRGAMERRARELHDRGHKTDLFHLMEKRGRERLTSGVWAAALDREDRMAKDLIHRAVTALGAGIASAMNLLDVEAVVVGGGLGTRLGEPYVERIAAAMQPHLFVDDRPPAMLAAALGDLGGAIGASLLFER